MLNQFDKGGNVIIGVDGEAPQEEIDAFLADFNARINIARALIINEFGLAQFDDVNTPEGQMALAESMTRVLQESFNTNLIQRVFFSEWTAQRGR